MPVEMECAWRLSASSGSNQNVSKARVFLFATFFNLGDGEAEQRRHFTDAASADVKLVGVREEDAEVKARMEADDWLWLNPRGSGSKKKRRKRMSSWNT